MQTKKLFTIIVFCLLHLFVFGQKRVVMQFNDRIHLTSQNVSQFFPPTLNAVLLDSVPCVKAYLIQLTLNSGTTVNYTDCDYTSMAQGGPPRPPSTTGASSQGGSLDATYTTDPSDFMKTIVPSNYVDSTWWFTWKYLIDSTDYRQQCPVKVAFLDTGIDPVWANNSWFSGKTISLGINGTTNDISGHGTHVAGITAQILKNYPAIGLVSVKIFNSSGSSVSTTTWDIIKGIGLAIQNNARIINMSLAYWPDPSCVNTIINTTGSYNDALKAVMTYAGDKYNVLFITSAGNQGKVLPTTNFYVYPSMFYLPNQINVAADSTTTQRWGLSNYGSSYVHTSAPGTKIKSAYYGSTSSASLNYALMSGTSMAAPHVAAISAIVAALNGGLGCGGSGGGSGGSSGLVCGQQAARNPHYLFIKNAILNSGIGTPIGTEKGQMQPYFAKESRPYTNNCCN
jgi:subtilisin family serine protease